MWTPTKRISNKTHQNYSDMHIKSPSKLQNFSPMVNACIVHHQDTQPSWVWCRERHLTEKWGVYTSNMKWKRDSQRYAQGNIRTFRMSLSLQQLYLQQSHWDSRALHQKPSDHEQRPLASPRIFPSWPNHGADGVCTHSSKTCQESQFPQGCIDPWSSWSQHASLHRISLQFVAVFWERPQTAPALGRWLWSEPKWTCLCREAQVIHPETSQNDGLSRQSCMRGHQSGAS